MEDFRAGKVQLLVASDIAARGLDIPGITHIFNYDIPADPKDYLHRAGRTARAGNKGVCISIVTAREIEMMKEYKKTFGIEIQEKGIYMGEVVEPHKDKNPRKE